VYSHEVGEVEKGTKSFGGELLCPFHLLVPALDFRGGGARGSADQDSGRRVDVFRRTRGGGEKKGRGTIIGSLFPIEAKWKQPMKKKGDLNPRAFRGERGSTLREENEKISYSSIATSGGKAERKKRIFRQQIGSACPAENRENLWRKGGEEKGGK